MKTTSHVLAACWLGGGWVGRGVKTPSLVRPACWLAAGCYGEELADLGAVTGSLNGELIGPGPLTRETFAQPDEIRRQDDTAVYYSTVGVSPNGSTAAGTITSRLNTLAAFISYYGFA